jgi:hypothetical protein
MWMHEPSGTVVPTAPGTLAAAFDAHLCGLRRARHAEILEDFAQFQSVLNQLRGGRPFQLLLTVSPVPLTATASGEHVLRASVEAKATLRSVAGELAAEQEHIDYFPAYEIVTHPKLQASAFAENLRSVREEVVDQVMTFFFAEHHLADRPSAEPMAQDPEQGKVRDAIAEGVVATSETACEEMILESFAPQP